ncbi:hypothetical protein AGMMS49556_01870 [Endomicrobiia bacterium]|nr:hypothetical protein AGMMS49556_01870 [Endomicrobiia bacterium]
MLLNRGSKIYSNNYSSSISTADTARLAVWRFIVKTALAVAGGGAQGLKTKETV